MTILTREFLDDGRFRAGLSMPSHLTWTDRQIDESLAQTWAARPAGPVWVFGYGSLMWNPLLAFVDRRIATLQGWHRSFCLRSIAGRGSPDRPGRVLSLLPGGEVHGVALQLDDALAADDLRRLWVRELTSGAYRPLWLPIGLAKGGAVDALVFVARTEYALHEPRDDAASVAKAIEFAAGAFGPNIDYLRSLDAALRSEGLRDPYVDDIVGRLDDVDDPTGPKLPATTP